MRIGRSKYFQIAPILVNLFMLKTGKHEWTGYSVEVLSDFWGLIDTGLNRKLLNSSLFIFKCLAKATTFGPNALSPYGQKNFNTSSISKHKSSIVKVSQQLSGLSLCISLVSQILFFIHCILS